MTPPLILFLGLLLVVDPGPGRALLLLLSLKKEELLFSEGEELPLTLTVGVSEGVGDGVIKSQLTQLFLSSPDGESRSRLRRAAEAPLSPFEPFDPSLSFPSPSSPDFVMV
jgi:hypothetical protein